MFDETDTALQAVRVEISKSQTVYFYYKPYDRESAKFPKEKTLLLFYFDPEAVNEKVIREYFSLIGCINKVALGSFLNKRGSQKKKRVVHYALVLYTDDVKEINKSEFQRKIIEFIENRKRRRVQTEFKLNDDDEYDEDGNLIDTEIKPDDDGFIEVSADPNNKNKFIYAKDNEMSFKVIKEEEDSFMEEIKVKRKKKRSVGGVFNKKLQEGDQDQEDLEIDEVYGKTNEGFWNIQKREKQKQSKSAS